MSAPRGPVTVLPSPPRGGVLLFAPHADDETLGAGGTLARHVLQGDPVLVVVVFDGLLGLGAEWPRDTRRGEAARAAEELGLAPFRFLEHPEGHAPGESELARGIAELATIVRAAAPRIVYGPWPGDDHPDHRTLARALPLALRAAGSEAELWGYEVWTPLGAERVIDVTEVWPRKRRALEGYRSQGGLERLLPLAEGRATARGAMLGGGRRAEAFARFPAKDQEAAR